MLHSKTFDPGKQEIKDHGEYTVDLRTIHRYIIMEMYFVPTYRCDGVISCDVAHRNTLGEVVRSQLSKEA